LRKLPDKRIGYFAFLALFLRDKKVLEKGFGKNVQLDLEKRARPLLVKITLLLGHTVLGGVSTRRDFAKKCYIFEPWGQWKGRASGKRRSEKKANGKNGPTNCLFLLTQRSFW